MKDVGVAVAVLVGETGMDVIVGVDEAVEVDVRLGVGVEVEVWVIVDVVVDVKVNVIVGEGVKVGEIVIGWKGVLVVEGVGVSVGVRDAVLVSIVGIGLPVDAKMLRVSVMVAGIAVSLAIGVVAFGSGAKLTAIQPKQ